MLISRLLVTVIAAGLSVGCGWAYPPNELASAARDGNLGAIERLVAAGANVNQPSGVNGWPPILHALHKGQHAAFERLLEHGASLDGEAGRQVLQWASGYGAAQWLGCEAHAGLVRLVLARAPSLKQGADEARSYARKKACDDVLRMLNTATAAATIRSVVTAPAR